MRAVALALVLLAGCVVVHVQAPPRAPVYECAAEDGSGRTVRVEYGGNPVDLSEHYADEPGGLWSCTSVTLAGSEEWCSHCPAACDVTVAPFGGDDPMPITTWPPTEGSDR